MQKLFIILILLSCNSCEKEGTIEPYSIVSVKFIDDEDYVFIETTEGNWDKIQNMAQLNATGYKYERFGLYLGNLIDTGYYPNPSIRKFLIQMGMISFLSN